MKTLIAMVCLLAFSISSAETTITYQGQLQDASGPYTGTPGMEFRLFDSLTGGSQIGATTILSAVPVTDGLFQVELDFGAGAFDGGARWLEIEVAGDILEPRQKITGSPWSHQALSVAAGSVGSDQIASGAVGSEELAEDSITIIPGAGLVGGGETALGGTIAISIAPGGVGSTELADPVQVNEIQAATVDAQTYLQDGQPFEPDAQTIVQTLEPEPGQPGTVWMRLDEPGTHIWQQSLHSLRVNSVFERNGVVYSGSNDNTVMAADASDGSLHWQHSLHGNNVMSVFERNGVVYSGSSQNDNSVFAADASDGSLLWQHSLHSGSVNSVFERNGVVYSGSRDNTVIAADSSDGSLLWQHSLHTDFNRVTSVFERNGVVYSGSLYEGLVIAADASDGSLLWQHFGSGSVNSVFERNGVVYFTATSSVIAAVSDPTTHVSDGNQWLLQARLGDER